MAESRDSTAMNEHPDSVRLEIAAAAARLIADSGLDYGAAKLKAARQLLGARPRHAARYPTARRSMRRCASISSCLIPTMPRGWPAVVRWQPN